MLPEHVVPLPVIACHNIINLSCGFIIEQKRGLILFNQSNSSNFNLSPSVRIIIASAVNISNQFFVSFGQYSVLAV